MEHGNASQRATGVWLVLAAATLWGCSSTAAKAIFNRAIDPLVLVEARLIIASLFLLAYLLVANRQALRVERRDLPYLAVLGMWLALTQATHYYSISATSVAVGIFLQYLAPLLMALYFGLSGREPITSRLMVALAAATGGGLLMVLGSGAAGQLNIGGVLAGVGSAVSLSIYTIIGQRGSRRYGAPATLCYAMAAGAIFWSFLIPPWRAFTPGLPAQTWGFYLYIALFATALPFTLYFAGLRYLAATRTALIATLEPVVGAVTAWLFIGERLAAGQLIGALLVIVGVTAVSARQRGRQATTQ